MGNTRKRNVTLLGSLIAALVLATLLLPALATSGDYGMTSGGNAESASTATPNPPTATAAPPTAVPTSALDLIVLTIAPQCPQGYSYDVTVNQCVYDG